jgi:predicted PurR-regulated permease PerM
VRYLKWLLNRGSYVSRLLFVGVVVVLLVACFIIGFIGYSDVTGLQKSYSELQSDYNDLSSTYIRFQISSSEVQSDLNSTQSQLSSLQSSYNQLENQYSQLNGQYQSLLSDFQPGAGITVDSINYNFNGTAPAGVTQAVVRNLGSSAVHVTSLKLFIGTTILVSSAAVFIEIQPNSSATINQFLPFALAANVYTLKVSTLEGYNATSDTIFNG